jgi:hypothetical protein
LTWLATAVVAGGFAAFAYTLLAPPEWPLFRARYETLKFLSVRGYDIANGAIDVRHPLVVEAVAGDIANGSSLEAGWACSMSQAMFMRGDSRGDAVILEQLANPIVQLLNRETNGWVRCLALGVVAKSDELARLARRQVLESLNSSHFWEAFTAAQIAIFRLREESLAKPFIDRLLNSDRDFELQEGLRMVSVMPDLSPYRQKIEMLQASSNPAISHENFQIKSRLNAEAEWFRRTNSGSGVR